MEDYGAVEAISTRSRSFGRGEMEPQHLLLPLFGSGGCREARPGLDTVRKGVLTRLAAARGWRMLGVDLPRG
jgi:hypothetical protein